MAVEAAQGRPLSALNFGPHGTGNDAGLLLFSNLTLESTFGFQSTRLS